MSRRVLLALSAIILTVTTGCADDSPAYHDTSRQVASTPRTYSPAPSVASSTLSDTPAPTVPDALESPDALAGPSSTPAATAQADDPLAQASDTLAGPAPGRAMPTDHSHWLKGSIFNARVTARLNGLYLGTYSAPLDRDITMKLRPGMNALTLTYQPLASTASAHLDVLESEHNPPIPPLATFRSPALQTAQTAIAPATTETLTFLAR